MSDFLDVFNRRLMLYRRHLRRFLTHLTMMSVRMVVMGMMVVGARRGMLRHGTRRRRQRFGRWGFRHFDRYRTQRFHGWRLDRWQRLSAATRVSAAILGDRHGGMRNVEDHAGLADRHGRGDRSVDAEQIGKRRPEDTAHRAKGHAVKRQLLPIRTFLPPTPEIPARDMGDSDRAA